MFTISDIITDIDRGCAANNMVETEFSYRVVFFVKEGNKATSTILIPYMVICGTL